SVRASSSITFGGRSATPWEESVRQRSTGSPPAPFSSSSTDQRFAIAVVNAPPRGRFHLLWTAVRLFRTLGPRQLAEAQLVGALWWYAASVLYPARALRLGGIRVVGPPVGEEPTGLPRPGLGLTSRRDGP